MPYKYVWDDGTLSAHAKEIYKLLEQYAGNQDRHCWPSVATLVEKSSLSRPTVKKALRELAQKGWVVIRHCSREVNGHSSNDYELRNPLCGQRPSAGQAASPQGGNPLTREGQSACPELIQRTKSMNRRGKSTPRGFASLGVQLGDD